jgi:hypothetical protein
VRSITTAILLLVAAGASAAPEADRRLTKALDRARLTHEVDGQGDIRVSFLTGEGRSQMVVVRSATTAFGSLDMRELVSAAYRSATMALPGEVANRLLDLNARARMGGWSRQGPMAVLITRIPAQADAKELADALEYTARAADAAERELNGGKDEY